MSSLFERLKTIDLWRIPNFGFIMFFFAAVVALYGRVIFFDIVYFDDHLWVKDFHSYLTRGIHWWTFFSKPDLVTEIYYRPLLNLSFAIDARTGAGAVWTYHLTNLVLHWVGVCLVFYVLKEWGFSRAKALVGALIMLVHPALVQAVIWIPGRTDSLLGLFCFAGLFFFLRYQRLRKVRDLACYGLCLMGALLTKETGIVLGFMTILWTLMNRQDFKWKNAWQASVVTLVLVLFWGFIRWHIIAGAPLVTWKMEFDSFIKNLPAIWLYLGKTFLPFNLSVFPILKDSSLMYGFIVVPILVAAFIFSPNRQTGKVLWASAWFIFFLLPSLVLSDLAYEYRLYVPMLGALVVCLELFPDKMNRRISVFLTALAVGVLALISWDYSSLYKNQWSFWPRAASESPHSPLAQRNLAAMYQLKGDDKEAERYYLRALDINPTEKMVHNNLGLIYQKRGELDKAVEFFQKEIKYHPDYDLPYYNTALMLLRKQDYVNAEKFLLKSIELNPLLTDAHAYLIQVYLFSGKIDQAKAAARRLRSTGADIPQKVLERARQLNVDL